MTSEPEEVCIDCGDNSVHLSAVNSGLWWQWIKYGSADARM